MTNLPKAAMNLVDKLVNEHPGVCVEERSVLIRSVVEELESQQRRLNIHIVERKSKEGAA